MIKKICFFSRSFAFNRLVRMRYYEKIIPKNIKIFLFTTNKHEKENSFLKGGLKRTKIICIDYNAFKLSFTLRKFCVDNNIDRVVNIGNFRGSIPLLIATIFSKRDYILNIFGQIPTFFSSLKKLSFIDFILSLILIMLIFFSKKLVFNDIPYYKKYSKIFPDKVIYIAGAVNTELFSPKNKVNARKKLKLPLNKKIMIYVGRVYQLKCSDILVKLIKSNPDICFIVIGEVFDKSFLNLNSENLIYFGKKSSEELVDFYNAADLKFFLHRIKGGGFGLVAEESLACGTPVILPKIKGIKKSKAVFQVPENFEFVNRVVSKFFKIPKHKRKEISKIARQYVLDNYSDEVWKDKNIKSYLT